VNLRPPSSLRSAVLPLAVLLLLTLSAPAQSSSSQSSSSSSSSKGGETDQANPVTRPRAAQIEQGGAAVTLEVSEPLFQVASALNACGYDADLDKSAPVRAEVRADMNQALAASEAARTSRDALCQYITEHRQNDLGLDVGQYVSLALYLSPPPELTPNVSELDLPPQAASVVNVLPLLRAFADGHRPALHLAQAPRRVRGPHRARSRSDDADDPLAPTSICTSRSPATTAAASSCCWSRCSRPT
jgi:hypothetical protein